jgi:hypothetical protein
MDSVLELNTKNLDISPRFLTLTHTTLSAKRFRSYQILTIEVAAEFCFWTEQRHNRYSPLGFRLTKTLEVLNTKLVGNSLGFPMVHIMVPNG